MPLFLAPYPPPLIVANEIIALTGVATTAVTGNQVYLYAFEVYSPTTFSGAKWRVGATSTGTTDIGIYSFDGNTLFAHTGAITNVASTNMSNAFTGGNVTLPAGQYFMAVTVSNSTDTLVTLPASNAGIMSRVRQSTNNATAGVLPSTTGGYSDVPARVVACALTVVGGLT